MKYAIWALVFALTGCYRFCERDNDRMAANATVLVANVDPVSHGVAQGTGVVIFSSADMSLILTCAHVVSHSDIVLVSPLFGQDYTGTIEKISKEDDLAIILVRAHMPNVFVANSAPGLYETVTVAGNPNGTRGVLFHTMITSYYVPFRNRPHWLLSGGVFYPGLSGGPVLNSHNEVVGIVSNVDTDDGTIIQGTGFCVSLDTIRKFISDYPL